MGAAQKSGRKDEDGSIFVGRPREKKEELKEAPPSELERMVFLVVETHEMLRFFY